MQSKNLEQWVWMRPLTYAVALRGSWDWGTNNLCPQDYITLPCSDRLFLSTEEFQTLLKRLPSDRFLNSTAISQYWTMDANLQHRYQQLGASLKVLLKKMHRIVRRLFNLCKRCHRQPRFRLPKERWARRLLPCLSPATPGHSCWGQGRCCGQHGRTKGDDTFILVLQTWLSHLLLSTLWS